MPQSSRSPRVVKGTTPTATYSTKAQVQGHVGNKTLQYLAELNADDPGTQGFYREALNDIPHPLETGKTLTYGGLQQALNSPQRAQVLDAYARTNRMDRVTAEQVQQAEFEAAKQRLIARANQNPGAYAFPMSADAARRAPNTAQAVAHGNFAAANGATNAAVQAQRFNDIAGTQAPVMAAPGMAVRLVRGATPAVAPTARVIPGAIATR